MRYRYLDDFRRGISVFAIFSYGIAVLGTPQCPPPLIVPNEKGGYSFYVLVINLEQQGNLYSTVCAYLSCIVVKLICMLFIPEQCGVCIKLGFYSSSQKSTPFSSISECNWSPVRRSDFERLPSFWNLIFLHQVLPTPTFEVHSFESKLVRTEIYNLQQFLYCNCLC